MSQCSETSSITELDDDPYPYVQDSPPSCIDQKTVKLSEPSQVSHSCTVAKDSDQCFSSCEEEWDETGSEGDDSSADGQHPQAKSFVKWIVALLLEITIQCYSVAFYLFYILFSTLCMLSPTPFLLAVCTLSPLHFIWRGGS